MTKHVLTPLAAAVALSLTQTGAYAQSGALEEVIVTAQKREQSLQETPIAITALNASAIERLDVRDVTDLDSLVPNLKLSGSPGNANGATVNIRGSVTINPALTMEPTVGIYLDGIYIGKNVGGIFDVADLERMEVLRGPQGTLYGKNTLGGAINLITQKPTGELGGNLRLTIGEDNLFSVKGSLDLPAIGQVGQGLGQLSTKLTYSQTTRDGFYDNVDLSASLPGANPASNDEFGNIDSRSGRLAMLLDVTDSLSVLYSYDFSKTEQNPQLFQLTRVDSANVPALGFMSQFSSPDRMSWGSMDDANDDNAEVQGHSLTVTWDAGDLGALGDVTFKSLSGYREIEALDSLDWDGTPYHLLQTGRDVEYEAKSQEFQMLGKTERLNYVVGLYAFQEEGSTINPLDLTLYASPFLDARYGLDNEAWAVYTQFDYVPEGFEDRLTLTVGARYTEEEKSIYRYFGIPAFNLVMLNNYEPPKESYENFSPTFTAAYQATDDLNVYFRVAKGWKAGVFNAEANSTAELDSPIDEEVVTSYELGLKSQWWDNRVQANVAIFQNDSDDIQISRFNQASASSVFTNAGNASVRGMELELVVVPTENLMINVGYGYLDAEYGEYMDECRLTASGANPCPAGVAPGQLYDAKDVNAFPYTPESTANVGIEYNIALGNGEAFLRADWSYSDDYSIYPDPFNNEFTHIDSYELLDLRAGVDEIDLGNGMVGGVTLWVKNATDEEYRVNGIEWGPITTMRFGDPRTAGVDFSVRF